MGVNPTQHQTQALDAIRVWFELRKEKSFVLGGLAGTGKSTIIPFIPAALRLQDKDVLFCAPTNKAKDVLRLKLAAAGVKSKVTTIHKIMMTAEETHCKDCPLSQAKPLTTDLCHGLDCGHGCALTFVNTGAAFIPRLIVCDEGSMVTDELHEELLSIAATLPVLFVGDHGQLPPVGNKFDKDFSVMRKPDFELEELHRGHTTIHDLARRARSIGNIEYGVYDEHVQKVHFADLEDLKLDDKDWQGITYFRDPKKSASLSVPGLNEAYRAMLGLAGRPQAGERVVAVSCRYIDKGTIGYIKEIKYQNNHTYDATIYIPQDKRVYRSLIHAAGFGFHKDNNHRGLDLWDYGYVITCHKAQGSEFDNVIVFEPPIYYRGFETYKLWLYTAITRAKTNLIIVG